MEIWAEVTDKLRYAFYGLHGFGKTCAESIALLAFGLTRDGAFDWKAPTTAGVGRQLYRFLWPEIHKWAARLRWEKMGWAPFDSRTQLQVYTLQLRTGAAFAVTCSNPETIEGAHADSLLYGYDEAKLIPGPTWDATEGAFSGSGAGKQEAFALAASTPGDPAGKFYEICSRAPGYQDWTVRHVTTEEAVAAGRVSAEWVEASERRWGADSPVFLQRVRGLFAASGGDGVIPLSLVEAAVERWKDIVDVGEKIEVPRHLSAEQRWRLWLDAGGDPGPLTHLGVDVAEAETGDDTVLAPRYGTLFAPLRYFSSGDPRTTASRAEGVLNAGDRRPPLAVVDGIGVGSGVVADLRADGYRVEAFIASEKTALRDKAGEFGFLNRRAAAWWFAFESLRDGLWALPDDPRLIGELTAPTWREISGGRIQIESKEDVKKRLDGRSTDAADAVVMAGFAEAIRGVARSNAAALLAARD